MKQINRFGAVLLMAGNSSRFGGLIKKPFQQLGDKYVYQWSLDTFLKHPKIEQVYLVVHEDDMEKVEGGYAQIVVGGKSRLESSFRGVQACKQNYVLIHDVARPFITTQIIDENIKAVVKYKAVDTCIKATDTMIESRQDQQLHQVLPRANLYHGQTPQSFNRQLILQAQRQALQAKIESSCDCSLVKRMNYDVHLLEGSRLNFKITYQEDLLIARGLIANWKTRYLLASCISD